MPCIGMECNLKRCTDGISMQCLVCCHAICTMLGNFVQHYSEPNSMCSYLCHTALHILLNCSKNASSPALAQCSALSNVVNCAAQPHPTIVYKQQCTLHKRTSTQAAPFQMHLATSLSDTTTPQTHSQRPPAIPIFNKPSISKFWRQLEIPHRANLSRYLIKIIQIQLEQTHLLLQWLWQFRN